MDVIKTATAVADKFGPGLNGFRSESPGLPATQLSPEWADSVQMELVYAITSQSIALDGLVFNQLQQAIDQWAFVNPSVTGSLTMANGSMLFIASGATLEVQSGGGLSVQNGSTLAIQSNVTLVADDNTWVWGTDNTNDWTINGNVELGTDDVSVISLVGNVSLGFDASSSNTLNGTTTLNKTLTGGAGSLVEAELLETDFLQFISQGTPSTTAGVMTFAGRFLTFGLSATAKKIAIYDDLYVASPANTAAALADTTAEVTLVLAIGDKVMISATMQSENSGAGNRVRMRIEANAVLIGTDISVLPGGANEPVTMSKNVEFTATAAIAYTFKLRHGAPNGGVTTTRDAWISVRHKH